MSKQKIKLPIYGVYQTPNKDEKLSAVECTFSPIDFISDWNRAGLTANYLANFQGLNFKRKEKIINILSTVINELIENTIKFSANIHNNVSIIVTNYGHNISISTVNSCYPRQAKQFEAFIQDLLSKEPESFFLSRIMDNSSTPESSQIGLITLKKDFKANIGAKIIPNLDRRLYDVYIKVELITSIIESL